MGSGDHLDVKPYPADFFLNFLHHCAGFVLKKKIHL